MSLPHADGIPNSTEQLSWPRSSPAVGWALSLQTTSRFDLNYQEVFASYPALLNYIAARIDYSGRTVGSELAGFTGNVGAYNPDPVLDSSHLIHSPGLPNQIRFGSPRRQSVVCRDEDDGGSLLNDAPCRP